MKTKLYPHQNKGIKELFDAVREGHRRVIWCYPTGAGKSTVSAALVEILVKAGKKALFTVHSRKLVDQFHERLRDQFGIDGGIIMSKRPEEKHKPVQVGSIQTIIRRDISWFSPDIIIIDEAHRAVSNSYKDLISKYPDVVLLLLTATPFRSNGSGLGSVADVIIHPIKIQELIDLDYLVGTLVYGASYKVNLEGIKIKKGDYDAKELFKRYNNDVAYDSVVNNYLKWAKGKKAIVFNINVEHSKLMNQAFIEAGIASAHLDGDSTDDERDDVFRKYENGEIDVLHNVALFVEGYDVPAVECVILNAATKSLGRYVQQVGRGLRTAEGKEHCIVLDHGGNTERHYYVEDYDKNGFDLTGRPKQTKKMEALKKASVRQCPKCMAIMKQGDRSCRCGYEFKGVVKEYDNDVKLELMTRDEVRVGSIQYKDIKALTAAEVRIFSKMKGYKSGWAYWHCKKELGWDLPQGKTGYMAANFLLSLEELKGGTYDYVSQLQGKKYPKVV